MRQKVSNLKELTDQLLPFLEQFLQEHGIDTSRNFRCINPKHDDENASMSCGGNKNIHVAHCFGCGCSANIFTAAHYLDNVDIKGYGFIEDNVLPLAKKYGVRVELEDLTQEEIYEFKTYDAYKYAADLIADRQFGDYTLFDKEIERRKWDQEKAASWGIGTVVYNDFLSRMKAAGYDSDFLSKVDLNRKDLFNSHNMLFTVHDDYGRPVGFSAKNLKHGTEEEAGPKYINTKGTGLECAIFKKGERLYGLHLAKNAPSPLYIFEGQADVITARHADLVSCCCTMGSQLTDHHINLLKRHNLFNVVLVFDADNAGQSAAIKALDARFAMEKDFRVKVLGLPGGMDPDELIRTRGISAFVSLRKWTAFEWRLSLFMKDIGDDDSEEKKQEIAEKMSQLIASEKSYVKQEEMAKQVAKMTGYSIQTIMMEVKRLRNEKEGMVQQKKLAAIESMLYDVRHNPDDAEIMLANLQITINDINKEVGDIGAGKGLVDFVLSQKEQDEARTGEFAGFKMRPEGLGNLAAKMDDDWTRDAMILIGGTEQSGKTTLATQMAYEIATENPDTICIYHSIDDAARMILYKWVCQAANDLQLTLNNVSNPNYWINQGLSYIKQSRELAYQKIIQLMKDQRLILSDASDGSSLAYAEALTKRYREMHPSSKIVLFIDNFHKLPDFAELHGPERTKRLSNAVKNMTVANGITIVSTVEYRKIESGTKPTNNDLAESRALAYDASVIIHLHNDLHHAGEDDAVLVHQGLDGKLLPRIWCKFGKNKISGYEGREFFDLYPANATYRSVDLEQALREIKERKAFVSSENTHA